MTGLNEGALPLADPREVFDSSVVIASTAIDGAGEEELFRRYKRIPKKKQNPTIEFTREPTLIHQYLEIYHSECRIIPEFLEAEEEYNSRSQILVVRVGNLVVGGGRLFVVTPRTRKKLLLELAGFTLDKCFPDLENKQMTYAEISRLVLLPDFRGEDVLRKIFVQLHRKCVALGVDIFFAAAPLANVRSYRKILKSIGVTEAEVHLHIEIPPDPGFEEIKDYLLSAKNNKQYQKDGDFDALFKDRLQESVL